MINNKIVLTREIQAHGVHFEGRIAMEERRPELHAFLLEARGESGVTAEEVSHSLLDLPNERSALARKLLDKLAQMNLLEKVADRYALTPDGETAITTERIFIDEQGTWSAWYVDDKLIQDVVISVAEWKDPEAFKETGKNAPRRTLRPPDSLLISRIGKVSQPAVTKQKVRIDTIPDLIEPVDPQLLKLTWEVDSRFLSISGNLEDCEIEAELAAPIVEPQKIWEQILEEKGLRSDWDAQDRLLRRGFDQVNDDDRRKMTMILDLSSSEHFGDEILPAFGGFKVVSLPIINITARDEGDAQKWAEWRLRDLVSDYATHARFSKWQHESIYPFKNLSADSISSRAVIANEFCHKLASDAPKHQLFWHVVAAQDWNL